MNIIYVEFPSKTTELSIPDRSTVADLFTLLNKEYILSELRVVRSKQQRRVESSDLVLEENDFVCDLTNTKIVGCNHTSLICEKCGNKSMQHPDVGDAQQPGDEGWTDEGTPGGDISEADEEELDDDDMKVVSIKTYETEEEAKYRFGFICLECGHWQPHSKH